MTDFRLILYPTEDRCVIKKTATTMMIIIAPNSRVRRDEKKRGANGRGVWKNLRREGC